ncbi:MAG: hypothetical protein ACUVUQ_09935, partial [Thermodesulfovibrionales bacterium]
LNDLSLGRPHALDEVIKRMQEVRIKDPIVKKAIQDKVITPEEYWEAKRTMTDDQIHKFIEFERKRLKK